MRPGRTPTVHGTPLAAVTREVHTAARLSALDPRAQVDVVSGIGRLCLYARGDLGWVASADQVEAELTRVATLLWCPVAEVGTGTWDARATVSAAREGLPAARRVWVAARARADLAAGRPISGVALATLAGVVPATVVRALARGDLGRQGPGIAPGSARAWLRSLGRDPEALAADKRDGVTVP